MSAATVTTEIVTVLGVLGVGSILGQYVASSKDRREARAHVLTALADAESARWAGPDLKASAEFQISLREFRAAQAADVGAIVVIDPQGPGRREEIRALVRE